MKNILILVFIMLRIILLCSVDVSGSQSGEWTQNNNPYNVVGDITVPMDDSLLIMHGVIVHFNGDYIITAQGIIKAIGTQTDSIRFISNVTWGEIRLENNSQQSRFSYCEIQNAETGLNSVDSPLILVNSFIHNVNKGVNIFGVGNPNPAVVIVQNCKIQNCDTNGIFIAENSNANIDSCDISYCALNNDPHGAIQVSKQSANGYCNPHISNCHIHHNIWQGISAFDVTGVGYIYIYADNNLIEYNLSGIYLLYASGKFHNNTIQYNFVSGNTNSGAGVMIYGFAIDTPVFTNNIVRNNFVGFYLTNNGMANLGCIIDDCEDDDGENYIYDNIDETETNYSVYNATPNEIWAQNNYWGTQDYNEIAQTIIDQNDNSAYGEVIFDPIADNEQADNNTLPKVNQSTLLPAYPNPFNPSTTIKFTVKDDNRATFSIYNIKGQKILTKTYRNGSYNFIWNGKDETGTKVSSGLYLYELKTSNSRTIRKMIMMK